MPEQANRERDAKRRRGWRARFVDIGTRVGQRIHRGTSNPHPVTMAIVAGCLLIAAIISWRALDLSIGRFNWWELLASALLAPASIALTAAEYRLIGAASGIGMTWWESMRITVFGTVANLLPIPGAAALRMNDLVARTARPKHAAGATVGVGVLWLGWALIVSGLALVFSDSTLVGWALTTAGVVSVAFSCLLSPTNVAGGLSARSWLTAGSAIEIASLAIGAGRIWLTLASFGLGPTFIQAVGLVAAGAIASTVGIMPGGLGVRELVAGILAPLVGLEVAAAIVTVAVVRVVGLTVSAPIALLVAQRASAHG